jgi:hypothetical protein
MRAELAFSLKPTPIAHTPRQHIPSRRNEIASSTISLPVRAGSFAVALVPCRCQLRVMAGAELILDRASSASLTPQGRSGTSRQTALSSHRQNPLKIMV